MIYLSHVTHTKEKKNTEIQHENYSIAYEKRELIT